MLMTVEEARAYAHIMETESAKERAANKRQTWQETDCIPARAKINYGNTKKGDILTKRNGAEKFQARDALTETDGAPTSDRNVCCHLCPNDSCARNGFVCINPHHLYWGSCQDNGMDKSPESKAAGGKVSANLQATCPHCGKTGQKWAMSRWHFHNCKDKK